MLEIVLYNVYIVRGSEEAGKGRGARIPERGGDDSCAGVVRVSEQHSQHIRN